MRELKYIKITSSVEVVEAIYVTRDNVESVSRWMGYEIVGTEKSGWNLQKIKHRNVFYGLRINTYIIDKVQTMDKKKFQKTYFLLPPKVNREICNRL